MKMDSFFSRAASCICLSLSDTSINCRNILHLIGSSVTKLSRRKATKFIHRALTKRRPASNTLLCSQSVVSPPPPPRQILNSALLTALSPSEAIKSMLIPRSTIVRSGGKGQSEPRHINPDRSNTLPGYKAGPQVR